MNEFGSTWFDFRLIPFHAGRDHFHWLWSSYFKRNLLHRRAGGRVNKLQKPDVEIGLRSDIEGDIHSLVTRQIDGVPLKSERTVVSAKRKPVEPRSRVAPLAGHPNPSLLTDLR